MANNAVNFLTPDVSERNIFMYSKIDEDSAKSLIESINKIDSSDKDIVAQNNALLNQYGLSADKMKFPPINIYLNSPGGYVYSGLAMYDTINKRNDLYCTVSGLAASAAFIFTLGFKKENRVCTANTTFMVHQVSGGIIGKVADMEEDLKESKRLNKILFDIISKNTKITVDELEENYAKKQDWFINAEEALKLGVVSKII